MKSKIQWLSVVGFMVLSCVVGWTAYAQKKVASNVTWEYTALGPSASYPVVEELNALGAKGWELVAVSEVGDTPYYFFKRAK